MAGRTVGSGRGIRRSSGAGRTPGVFARVRAGAVALSAMALLLAAAGPAGAQGAVTAVAGDRVDLFLGPGHGASAGDVGVVWRVETTAAGYSRERVATIRAVRVSAQSAVAQITERIPGREIGIGMEASFAEEDVPREDEIVSLVELGDRLYQAGEYDAAAGAYERASALDPTVRDAGVRHVTAMVRGAVERGDRGPVFDAAVSAFGIVEQMQLPPDLTRRVDEVAAALEQALATPTPTPTPAPPTATPAPSPTPTPPAVREGDIVEPGPGVVPPVPVTQVNPVFPEAARRRNESGHVELSVLVGVDGRVEEVRVLGVEPAGRGLEEAADRAIRRWRFEPATIDGTTVRFWYRVRFRFTP